MGVEVEENDATWVPLTPEVTMKSKNIVHKKSGSKKAMEDEVHENDPTWVPQTPKVNVSKNDLADNLKRRSPDDNDTSNRRPHKRMRIKIHRPKVFDDRPVKIATPKPRTPPKTGNEGKARKGGTPKTKTGGNEGKTRKCITPKTGKESKRLKSVKKISIARRKLQFCNGTNDENSDQKVPSTPPLQLGINDESDCMVLSTYGIFKRRRMARSRISVGKLTELVKIIHDKCMCPFESTLNLSWPRHKGKRSKRRRRVNEFIAANKSKLNWTQKGKRSNRGHCVDKCIAPNKSELGECSQYDAFSAHEYTRDKVKMDGLDLVNDVSGIDLEFMDAKLPTDSSSQPQEPISVFSIKGDDDGEIYGDFLSQRMVNLYITDEYQNKANELKQLILFNQKKELNKKKQKVLQVGESKQLTVLNQKKKEVKAYRVDLDDITLGIWDIRVENNEGDDSKEEDSDREYWEKEREECVRKLDTVMSHIHPYLGDRPFSRWKGSVVDSIVGVFLTQNVSDSLSSSAFMNLTSRYPPPVMRKINNSCNRIDCSVDEFQHESQQDECNSNSRVELSQLELDIDIGDQICTTESQLDLNIDIGEKIYESSICTPSISSIELSQVELTISPTSGSSICTPSKGTRWRKKKGKGEAKYKSEQINWDNLRKIYGNSENRQDLCVDSVDWEAVRQASTSEFAAVIEQRGMSNQLAGKIKPFLDRLVKDHGTMDLEWLRNVPMNEAKDYLLSIYGLGLKSADCVMLLSLYQRAFPVDVNIGRVLVRLGIVPLKPLPEGVLFHNLDSYPLLDDVEKYLWPRICNLDVPKLYALHCYLNAFSKAFCTKKNPNCNACPMKGDCKHYASVLASSRIPIEDSKEKKVAPESSTVCTNLVGYVCEDHPPSQNYEPIIEFPASPKYVFPERDIEDLGIEDFESEYDIVQKSRSILRDSDDNINKSLIAIKPRNASTPPPKLKHLERLRTVHQVFELPDCHPLLAGFENRQSEDPNPYLLAIWLTEQNEDSPKLCSCPQSSSCGVGSCCSRGIVQYQHVETVQGTILIPSRTAVRGSFPLNGTYFQFNEVFADHDSSVTPVDVPTKWLESLTKRILYCGTTITSICKDMSLEEIAFNFSRCFICIRGFDVKTRGSRRLSKRFHCLTIKPIGKR